MAKLSPDADAAPDADLIRACAEHIVNMHAYNNSPDTDADPDKDGLWAAYEATRDAITEARPQTIEGILAIARAAMAEAGADTNAEDRGFHSIEEHLSWNLVHDLLRLHGEDKFGLPDGDAELITLCADFEANERQIRAIYNCPDQGLSDDEAAHAAAPYEARNPAMLDRMAELRADTAVGIHARARVLAFANGDAAFAINNPEGVSARLYAYLCRDARALQLSKVAA